MVAAMSNESVGSDHVDLDPTPMQARILVFIVSYRRDHWCCPTLREIAAKLQRDTATIHEHIGVMRERGLILRYGKGYSRNCSPTARAERWVNERAHDAQSTQKDPS